MSMYRFKTESPKSAETQSDKYKGVAGKVLRLPKNGVGRDFVVGDVHGAFHLVNKAMDAAGFDEKRDRLISVGDLIDRGPHSIDVLNFLGKPYVYSVQGNHENDFYLRSPEYNRLLAASNYNGLDWVKDLDLSKIVEIQNAFCELPLVIEIQSEIGPIGIVHADVPTNINWEEFVSGIFSEDNDVCNVALNSRARFKDPVLSSVRGVERVFVGHATLRYPICHGNLYGIDTGATLFDGEKSNPGQWPGYLTMVDICIPPRVFSSEIENRNPASGILACTGQNFVRSGSQTIAA